MQQVELFEMREQVEAPGFSIRPNYVTEEEESDLLAQVEHGPWETDWRRRIQQYGLGYAGAHGHKASWIRDFPPWLAKLAARVAADAGMPTPENSVINEYIPPLGIAPHRDYHTFGPTIACVSLGSDVVMDLLNPEEKRKVSVHVPARSLWVMTGPARAVWLHGIAPRLNDVIAGVRKPRGRRVSITVRTAALPSAFNRE